MASTMLICFIVHLKNIDSGRITSALKNRFHIIQKDAKVINAAIANGIDAPARYNSVEGLECLLRTSVFLIHHVLYTFISLVLFSVINDLI
jgi:hypothetical protein